MIYLAANSGMRPQEYLVLPEAGLRKTASPSFRHWAETTVSARQKPRQAGGSSLSGRTLLDMVRSYAARNGGEGLVFATKQGGSYQRYRHYLRSGWHKLMRESGLMVESDAGPVPKYTPYALRHFFASMLIDRQKNLKFIQTVMGHADLSTTFDVYGHLIQEQQTKELEVSQGVLCHVL